MRSLARFPSILIAAWLIAGCSGGGGSGAFSGQSGGSGGTGGGTPPSSPSSGSAPLLPPPGSIYLGAFVNTVPGGDVPNMAHFESQIGRRLALSLHYHGWTDVFPGADEAADAAAGRIPIVSWNCGTTDALVAAGAADATIAEHADALRAYGKPVFLRYKWEMNRPDDVNGRTQCANPADDGPSGSFSPPDFIAAWNHIRAIFVSRGANNVAFLWNPCAGNAAQMASYYPGDATVDWVGIDQYDRNDGPFAQAYNMYAEVVAYGKPIVIAETGANPAYQSTFLGAAAPALATLFPEVKGYVYFDAPGNLSWTLSPAGVAAFAAMSREPYFSAP